MARIRTIKPDFWDDELIAELSRDARLLFIGTWNFADDEGRIRWSPAYIKSKVFPYDEDLSVDAVAMLMAELEKLERVRAYTVEGATTQRFAMVINLPKHQVINRAKDSTLPPPPDPDDPSGSDPGAVTDESVSEQGTLMDESLLEGKGREGKGREGRSTPPRAALATDRLARFQEFYSIYPRRKERRAAEKAWLGALDRGVEPERIINAAREYARLSAGSNYVKYPATWLNKGCYDDEPDRVQHVSRHQQRVDEFAQYLTETGTEGATLRALPGGNHGS